MKNETIARVIALISDETGMREDQIRLESDLLNDLGVDGDDAREIMERFSKEFNVDLSRFDLENYFNSEGSFNPIMALFPSWWAQRRKLHHLTVADLVQAAELGAWRET